MLRSPFEPCLPTGATAIPSSKNWIVQLKHDDCRLIVHRDGACVRLFTGTTMTGPAGNLIQEAALRRRPSSFVLDWKAVLLGVDGRSDFDGLHSRRHDAEVQFYTFDMLVSDGDDLRRVTLPIASPTSLSCSAGASTAFSYRTSRRERSARTCSGTPA